MSAQLQGHAATLIIGGGFSGISAAIHQIRDYLSLYRAQPETTLPLTISIVDANGSFGP